MQTVWQRVFLSGLWVGFLLILLGSADYYNWQKTYAPSIGVLIWILLAIFAFLAAATTIAHVKNEKRSAGYLLKAVCLLLVISAMVTVCFFGKSQLYNDTGLWLSREHLSRFFAFLPVVLTFSAYTWAMWHRLEVVLYPKERVVPYPSALFLHAIALLAVQGALLALYAYGLYPGTISQNMLQTWGYIAGNSPFPTDVPAAYVWLIQGIYALWPHVFAVSASQIIAYLSITTAIFLWLLYQKIHPVAVYTVAILLALWPQTGIQLLEQGPEVFFYLFLLWLSFIMLRWQKNPAALSSPVKAVEFCLAFLGTLLFAPSGRFIGIVVLLWLGFFILRKGRQLPWRKKVILPLVALLSLTAVSLLVSFPAANPLAEPVFQGYAAIYQGEAEANIYTPEEQTQITTIATPQEIRRYYNPYLADTFALNVAQFSEKLSALPPKERWHLYQKGLMARPDLLLGDRFNLTVSLWSVSSDPHSDSQYLLPYTTEIDPLFTDRFDVERIPNSLTATIEKVAQSLYAERVFLAPIVWRPALALVFFLLLGGYTVLRRKPQGYLWPIGAYSIALFFTMTGQVFRLLWCVPLFIGLLFLMMTTLPEHR